MLAIPGGFADERPDRSRPQADHVTCTLQNWECRLALVANCRISHDDYAKLVGKIKANRRD